MHLNSTRLPVRNWKSYVELYTKKAGVAPAAPQENADGVPLPSAPAKEIPILTIEVSRHLCKCVV